LITTVKHNDPKLLNRRRLLKLAVASALVVAGCTNVRQGSDLARISHQDHGSKLTDTKTSLNRDRLA